MQTVEQQIGPARSGPLSPEHRHGIHGNASLGEVIHLALTALQTILI